MFKTMTPEQYIAELSSVQYTLDSVREDLDRAISRMKLRIETGFERLERDSRLAVLSGREYVKLVDEQLLKVGTAEIEY